MREQLPGNLPEDHPWAHLITAITLAEISELYQWNLLMSSHVRWEGYTQNQEPARRKIQQLNPDVHLKHCPMSWWPAGDNSGWEERRMWPGQADHHLSQGHREEKWLQRHFLWPWCCQCCGIRSPWAPPQSAGWYSGYPMKFKSNQHWGEQKAAKRWTPLRATTALQLLPEEREPS